jgi:hypothetical protein
MVERLVTAGHLQSELEVAPGTHHPLHPALPRLLPGLGKLLDSDHTFVIVGELIFKLLSLPLSL